ncbi:MAG: hypothetical protein AAF630_02505 [Cyanobacteria bacterium P01_C01_bin.38]
MTYFSRLATKTTIDAINREKIGNVGDGRRQGTREQDAPTNSNS